jgi:hypothetical protein
VRGHGRAPPAARGRGRARSRAPPRERGGTGSGSPRGDPQPPGGREAAWSAAPEMRTE